MLKAINLKLTAIDKNVAEFSVSDVITGFLVTTENSDEIRVILSETCSRSDSYDFGQFTDSAAAVDAVTDIYTLAADAEIKVSLDKLTGTISKYYGCSSGCAGCKKRAERAAASQLLKAFIFA